MLIQEEITIHNGEKRIKSYSDAGKFIKQIETNRIYRIATDVPNKYTYEETDLVIPTPSNQKDEQL